MTPARLELDYVAVPRRPAWPGVLLLALSLLAVDILYSRYRDAQQELARLQATDSLLNTERRRVRAPSAERPDDELKNAEAVRRQLALPWGALIESVEAAANDDVAILLLQPDALQRVLRLTAEARDRDAMFGYLRRLGASPVLAEVHLVGHQIQLDDPRRPVQFSVQAAMRSAP